MIGFKVEILLGTSEGIPLPTVVCKTSRSFAKYFPALRSLLEEDLCGWGFPTGLLVHRRAFPTQEEAEDYRGYMYHLIGIDYGKVPAQGN